MSSADGWRRRLPGGERRDDTSRRGEQNHALGLGVNVSNLRGDVLGRVLGDVAAVSNSWNVVVGDLDRRPVHLPGEDGPGLADEVPYQPRRCSNTVEGRQHYDLRAGGNPRGKFEFLRRLVGYLGVGVALLRGPVLSLAATGARALPRSVVPVSVLVPLVGAAVAPPGLLLLLVLLLLAAAPRRPPCLVLLVAGVRPLRRVLVLAVAALAFGLPGSTALAAIAAAPCIGPSS